MITAERQIQLHAHAFRNFTIPNLNQISAIDYRQNGQDKLTWFWVKV